MRHRIIEAALIAIGLIALGGLIKTGMDNFTNRNRNVTVKGLSEREVEADKVTWPIPTKELGNDLPTLYEKINATTQKVKTFLKQNGIKEEEISVNAPVVIDMSADQYASREHDYRYNITSTITVTSANVKLVRSIIARQGDETRHDAGSHQERGANRKAVRGEQRQQARKDKKRHAGAVLYRRQRPQHALCQESARRHHGHLCAT